MGLVGYSAASAENPKANSKPIVSNPVSFLFP